MKIDKRDTIFSLLVRERADQRCEKCNSTEYLQCSHHVSRRFTALRWDPANACCHCKSCHAHFTYNPHDHYEWIAEFIGAEAFDELRKRSIGIYRLTAPQKEDIYQSLKESWSFMQQQRREGATGRLEFPSPYQS